MVAIAMRYLGNHDDAEDITQDALIKLWAMHEMLRESEVERIAFTVLKHRCIDELRRREYRKGKQTVSIDNIDIAMESVDPHEIEEREKELMIAVGKLPSRQRLLLQMRYINGKDVHTIAQITGSSEESIYMALSRARNKVYKLMAVVVVAVCMVLLPMRWNQTSTQKNMAHVQVKVKKMPNDDTLKVEKPLMESQTASNGVDYPECEKNAADVERKTQTDIEKVMPEILLHYQQVLSESYQQVMSEEYTDPDFYALCAYANERTEALSKELVGQRSGEATYKKNSTDKYDDL